MDKQTDQHTVAARSARSSGNVFIDLQLDYPDAELAKAELALTIRRAVRSRGLSQAAAARLLGTDQARISELMKGKVTGFTYDRLLRFLNALSFDVRIMVEAVPEPRDGRTLVSLAK